VRLTIHVEYKYTIQCRYKTSVLGCYIVPTSHSWNSIHLVMRLLTLTFECFFVFAVQWYFWQSSKLFSELAFEDFLCLYYRVTSRFMLRMQRELNTSRFWLSQCSRNFNSEPRSRRFIILDKMLWPFTTSAHTTRCMPFLAPISFLWRRKRHTFSCLFLNQNHELSRSHSRQIDLRRQCLHPCDLLPCWLRAKVAGVAY